MALTDDEVTDLLKALVAKAPDLGLTWQIAPATVIDYLGGQARVKMDGDDETLIPVVMLAGGAAVLSRVFVIDVPPNGKYAIGMQAPISLDVVQNANGILATSSGGVETPVASWTDQKLFTFLGGHMYNIKAKSLVNNTSGVFATVEAAVLRVRTGTNSIAGTLLGQVNVPTYGTASAYMTARIDSYAMKVTGDLTTSLGLSILRVVGANNQVIFGDSTQPVMVEVVDMGPIGAYPNLAKIALAIS